MGLSLLELIGKQKLAQDIPKNIFLADEVIQSGYYNDFEVDEAYVYKSPIDRSDNNNDFNSVDIEVIGTNVLSSLYNLNFYQPTEFIKESIFYNDVNVINSPPIEQIGQNAYNNIIVYNKYANLEYVAEVLTEPVAPTPQLQDYIEYISTIKRNIDINGQNYVDIILGNVGFEDSQLGVIGSDALRTHFELNAASILERNSIGRINTNPYSLLKGDGLLLKDYEITVGGNFVERGVNFFEKLSGFNLPLSPITDDVWGLYENKDKSTEDLTEALLNETGRAQQKNLFYLLGENRYKPIVRGRGFNINGNYYISGINSKFKDTSPFDSQIFNSLYIQDDLTFFPTDNEDSEIIAGTPEDAANYGVKHIVKNTSNPDIFGQADEFDALLDVPLDQVEWNPNYPNYFHPKSLLHYTKGIINNNVADDLTYFNQEVYNAFTDLTAKEYTDQINGVNGTISRGDATSAKNAYVDDDGTEIKKGEFFRVWTKNRGYNRLSRTLRHRGLDNGDTRSVLGDNGLVHIAPTIRNKGTTNELLYRKYMFSLENLAWADNIADLPDCEIGIGDILTGRRGRIMWFPPYNLQFSESVTANWSTHNFIGRGESIYTYNNTTRSGTLSFSIIVDHPEVVNKLRGKYTQIWERYFKGDKSVEKEVQTLVKTRLNQKDRNELEKIQKVIQPKSVVVDQTVVPPQIKEEQTKQKALSGETNSENIKLFDVYFPNEETILPSLSGEVSRNAGYENGDLNNFPNGLGYTYFNGVQRKVFKYQDNTNFGLNKIYYSQINQILQENFSSILNKNPKSIKITIIGQASSAQTPRISNFNLGLKRAENIKTILTSKIKDLGIDELIPPTVELTYETTSKGDLLDLTSANPTSESDAPDLFRVKVERKASVYISYLPQDAEDNPESENQATIDDLITTPTYTPDPNSQRPANDLIDLQVDPSLLDKLMYSECDFFEYLEINDPYSYNTISQKVKYFSPAFHSITPQGFNSRLTFLHQCTRQGNSPGIDGIGNINNLAFGRPPVCILRIGDFFYTKIIINSLNISYEPLVWDLNPEGIGVQPMIANITLGIVILGGSSMSGPINRLQNALSYNFYANTEMYDIRSDSIEINIDEKNVVNGKIIDGVKLSNIFGTDRVKSAEKILSNVNESGIFLDKQNKNAIEVPPENIPSEIDDVGDLIKLKEMLNLFIDEKNK